jgi:hypothetical protein
MDPRGALTVLGLTRPTSADTIRRAYLKGVRAHSPERDPDGFREVRAAYELLQGAPATWLAGEDAAPPEPEPENTPSEVTGEPYVVTLPDAVSKPLAPPREPAPRVVELKPALPPLLVAIKTRDAATAVSILLEVLEGRPTERARGFAPWHVLEVTVGLLTEGDFATAVELLQKFDAWARALGIGAREIGSVWVARWTLLRELTSLNGKIDADVLRALIEAVRTSNFGAAIRPLERAQEKDDSFESRFKRFAPTLHATLWPRVIPMDRTVRKLRSRPGLRGIGGMAALGFVILRILTAIGGLEPRTRTPFILPDVHQAMVNYSPPAPESSPAPSFSPEQRLERLAERIDRSIASGDCQDVRDSWPVYVEGVRRQRIVAAGRTYTARRADAVKMCGELESVLPGQP